MVRAISLVSVLLLSGCGESAGCLLPDLKI